MSDSEDYSDADVMVIDHDDVSNYNTDNILPKSPEEIDAIREWLQPTSYNIAGGEFRKHHASRAEGTGDWLTDTSQYQEWLRGSTSGLLWIKGIPGSGKSVHMARLINDIGKEHADCPVLFFFFRQIIAANHTPRALLCDWMDQLLKHSPPLQHRVWAYIEDQVSLASLSIHDLLKDLQAAFRALPDKVFCVADALDEMDHGNDAFLEAIGLLGQWKPAKVKVLISSRPVPQVEDTLRPKADLVICLEESLVDSDISTYVQHTLSQSLVPQELWGTVMSAVPGRANGLFLYARLAMEAFVEPGADIETVLESLPADLNVLYTNLLHEHSRRSMVDPSLQKLILQSVTHATRPLRLLELAEMCRATNDLGRTRDLRGMKDLVKTACGPLLEILPDETVSVVHHSLTEYLKGVTRSANEGGYPVLRPGPSHARLALCCLQYLKTTQCLDQVEVTIDDTDQKRASGELDRCTKYISPQIADLRIRFPFFWYAAHNWHMHARNIEEASQSQDEITELLLDFFSDGTTVKAWLEVVWPGLTCNARRFSTLHIAGRYGLATYASKLILERPGDIDVCDVAGKTSLWWAASSGHVATTRRLLEAGAEPNLPDLLTGRAPLHEAALKNHSATVKALLEAGVDPLQPVGPTQWEKDGHRSGDGRLAITLACQAGHVETVSEFLPSVDVETAHRCLSWAAGAGHATVVKLILALPGVEVDAMVRGSTALFKACTARDLATVRALLEVGANPDLWHEVHDDEFGEYKRSGVPSARFTSLHMLCGGIDGRGPSYQACDNNDWPEIATLLIEAGANLHHQMADGRTALHHAVKYSYHLAETLVRAGASANLPDKNGKTPIYYVQIPACIFLLVKEAGANVNVEDNYSNTPLLAKLTQYGSMSQVMLLLEAGADARVLDRAGNSTIHVAIKSHCAKPAIIQALLDRGANPDSVNSQGKTPLMLYDGFQEAKEIWDLLLMAGADIHARDRDGQTIFWHRVSRRARVRDGQEFERWPDLQYLIDRGADPHLRDFRGRTCLHEAIKAQSIGEEEGTDTPCLDYLLSTGLDHAVVDYHGNSLLHELAAREKETSSYGRLWVMPLWKRLFGTLGMDISQQNHFGRTPLHILCDAYEQNDDRYGIGPEPVDFIISHMRSIDVPDREGLSALHIASGRTEYCTQKLLEAGADIRATTHKGLTPLHIAARAQQSNICGMLIRSRHRFSRRKETSAEALALHAEDDGDRNQDLINAKDADGLCALYYAVRSGRPETVSILLQGGAKVDGGGDLFEACGAFEQECAQQPIKRDPLSLREVEPEGSPAKVPFVPHRSTGPESRLSDRDTRRLEEIVRMLVHCNADTSAVVCQSRYSSHGILADCVWQGKAYAASCLLDGIPRSTLGRAGDYFSELQSVSGPAYGCSLAESESFPQFGINGPNFAQFYLFLKQRQYKLVAKLAMGNTRFLPDPSDRFHSSHFAVLVRHGFGLLVGEIGKIEAERALGLGDWHAFGDVSKAGLWCANRPTGEAQAEGKVTGMTASGLQSIPEPFLLEAVKRDLPNLFVVRKLVEVFHVDVNETTWKVRGGEEGGTILMRDMSALHYVAEGRRWWHVDQALKYLLKVPGVKIEQRIGRGHTPLLAALESPGQSPRHRPHAYDAVRILLKAGANVHAMNEWGESCLSLATRYDNKMIQLLLKYGAVITAEDIVTAVRFGRPEALRELLQSRSSDEKHQGAKLEPALHQAGMLFQKLDPEDCYPPPKTERTVGIEMIQLLLEYGANPLSDCIILEPTECHPMARLKVVLENKSSLRSADAEGYAATLLHHLVSVVEELPVELFLIPGLDLEYQDPCGRTVLHAACRNPGFIEKSINPRLGALVAEPERTVFDHLVGLGARLDTLDRSGANLLMSLIGSGGYSESSKSWRRVLKRMLEVAPGLVHHVDLSGDGTLHFAARRATLPPADVGPAHQLLRADVSVVVTNNRGENALHELAKGLHMLEVRELFECLVKSGVDVNVRNNKGETPLFNFVSQGTPGAGSMYGDEQGWHAAIPLLLDLGADFFAKDNRGQGLLHVAAVAGDPEHFRALLAVGLDPLIEDNQDQTAIDIAAANSMDGILELFEKKI